MLKITGKETLKSNQIKKKRKIYIEKSKERMTADFLWETSK